MTEQIITTTDMYKAAYFLLYGGILVNVKKKSLPERKRGKIGLDHIVEMTIEHVPDFVVSSWESGQAYGNITEFARMRWRLKEKVRKFLQERAY